MKTIIFSVAFLIAIAYVSGETDCQERRRKAEQEVARNRPGIPVPLIPECKENGDYAPLQCHRDSSFCQCWTPDGDIVTQPSRRIKACDCLVEKHMAERRGAIGAYVPQCKPSGHYEKKQCHGSTGMCWCADENGTRLRDPVRGDVNCD